ncbi:nucleoside deaminase [Yinghuangia aomiensis]
MRDLRRRYPDHGRRSGYRNGEVHRGRRFPDRHRQDALGPRGGTRRRSTRRRQSPFGAVLAGTGGNIPAAARNSVGTTGDVSGHAETNLVRIATTRVDAALLPGSTLYTSCEPCAMCAGAIYWSGIGRGRFRAVRGRPARPDRRGRPQPDAQAAVPCGVRGRQPPDHRRRPRGRPRHAGRAQGLLALTGSHPPTGTAAHRQSGPPPDRQPPRKRPRQSPPHPGAPAEAHESGASTR